MFFMQRLRSTDSVVFQLYIERTKVRCPSTVQYTIYLLNMLPTGFEIANTTASTDFVEVQARKQHRRRLEGTWVEEEYRYWMRK